MSIVFDHVNIVVEDENDFEATKNFFVNTFGFTPGPEMTLQGAWVDELNGYKNCKATFVPLAPPTSDPPPTPLPAHIEVLMFENPPSPPAAAPWTPNHLGYRHIALDVPNIQELYQQLSPNWKFLSEPVPVPEFKLTTVYFIGPGNVLIQLTQKDQPGGADA
jgi:catechol 2,3-dioxygenase-like lactoylglutathione lyase family enzyme